MAFTNPLTGVLLQTNTDGDLDGLQTLPGVTRTIRSGVSIYNIGDNIFQINGIMTINPEVNRLVGSLRGGIRIGVGATLTLGGVAEKTVRGVVYRRLLRGAAIISERAGEEWDGILTNINTFVEDADRSISVQGGATLIIQGATLQVFGTLHFAQGSQIYMEDAIISNEALTTSQIDPLTGVNASAGVGKYIDANIPDTNRGFISVIDTDDLSIDGLTLIRGGEMVYRSIPNPSVDSGVGDILTLDGLRTPKRGISGLASENANRPIYPFGNETITFTGSRVINRGNDIDLAMTTPAATVSSTTVMVNSDGGTALRCVAADGASSTNRGSVRVMKQVNVNLFDAVSQLQVEGAAVYASDTDNELRTALYQNATGFTFTANSDQTIPAGSTTIFDDRATIPYFAQTNVSGTLDNNHDILLGTIKVPAGVNPQNSNNDPADTAPVNDLFRWDLRGEANVPGDDRFTFHIWHPDYLYVPITQCLSDGTDIQLFDLGLIRDPNYSNNITTGNLTSTDQMYDIAKMRKNQSLMNVEDGGASDFGIEVSGRTLDFGTRSVDSTTTNKLGLNFIRFKSNRSIQSTNRFNRIITTSTIDLNLFDITTDITLEASSFENIQRAPFPAGWTLTGIVTYGTSSLILFDEATDVSGIDLVVASGATVFLSGKSPGDFNSITGNVVFQTRIILSADHAGDITLYDVTDDTFQHTFGRNTAGPYGVDSNRVYRAVVSSAGRLGIPIEFTTVEGPLTSIDLTSIDLSQLGYDGNQPLDTIIYRREPSSILIRNPRQILTATQSGGNYDYFSSPARGVRWFGALCGARDGINVFNEVLCLNFDVIGDTPMFELDPETRVTILNFPFVRAIYGFNPDRYQFIVDLSPAKAIDATFLFTDEFTGVASLSEENSLITTPSDVNGFVSVIDEQLNIVISDISDNIESGSTMTQSHVSFEIEQQTRLGITS